MLCVCFAINISHDISHNISLEDLIIPSFQYMYLIIENFNFYLVFRVKFSRRITIIPSRRRFFRQSFLNHAKNYVKFLKLETFVTNDPMRNNLIQYIEIFLQETKGRPLKCHLWSLLKKKERAGRRGEWKRNLFLQSSMLEDPSPFLRQYITRRSKKSLCLRGYKTIGVLNNISIILRR